MLFSRRSAVIASLFGALCMPALAQAVDYPKRPLKIVYTYAAGGPGDAISRALAQALQKPLGQPVIVENRPGANGGVGTLAVAQAPGDGYTLLLTTITTVVQAPSVLSNVNVETIKGLVPISTLVRAPQVLVVSDKVQVKDYPSFVDWARKQAGGVSVAVAGPTDEKSLASLASAAKLNTVPVSYRGQAPALAAMLGGEVSVWMGTVSGPMIEHIQQGKLKVIGVTTAEPSPAVPGGVPLGRFVSGYAQDINFALWAPVGTPPEIVNKLTTAVHQVLDEPGMAEKFLSFSMPLFKAGPSEVMRIFERESVSLLR